MSIKFVKKTYIYFVMC